MATVNLSLTCTPKYPHLQIHDSVRGQQIFLKSGSQTNVLVARKTLVKYFWVPCCRFHLYSTLCLADNSHSWHHITSQIHDCGFQTMIVAEYYPHLIKSWLCQRIVVLSSGQIFYKTCSQIHWLPMRWISILWCLVAFIFAQSCGWLMTPVKEFTSSGMVSSEMTWKTKL